MARGVTGQRGSAHASGQFGRLSAAAYHSMVLAWRLRAAGRDPGLPGRQRHPKTAAVENGSFGVGSPAGSGISR